MNRLLVMLMVVMLSGVAAAQTPTWYGDWAVTSVADEFTDEEQRAMLAVPTEQPSVLGMMGLAVMCEENVAGGVLVAVLDHPEFLFERFTKVTFRVDSKPAVTAEWAVSRVGVTPVGGDTVRFVNELMGGDKLLLRLSAGGSSYEFSLFGFDQALAALGCYAGLP